VVAGADGAELVARHALELADLGRVLPQRAVEQLVLDLLGVAPPDPEGNVPGDVGDGPTSSAIASRLTSRRTAMLPQPISKPTPLTEMCSS
jgi:hypothetical protein